MTTRTVPLSPTAGMRMAGSLAIKHHYAREGGWCGILAAEEQMMLTWRAMIAAAPAEPDPAADPRLVREFREADAGIRCTHGWRGHPPEDGERIKTPCPACGRQSLFIGDGGHLTCAWVPSDHNQGCDSPGVEETIDKLKRDLAASQDRVRELRESQKFLHGERMAEMRRAEIAEQERDALAKDVERYRWLRDDKYWADICRPVHGNDCEHVAGVELDSVIDAAIVSGRVAT